MPKSNDSQSSLEFRARLISAFRNFFLNHSFAEVNTPAMVETLFPEEFIEAFSVGEYYLRTSPELEMKQLLAKGAEKIFQIGPCFREGETGRLHSEEFTMLEWYQTGIDYRELLDFTAKLISAVVQDVSGLKTCEFRGKTLNFAGEWEIISVQEALAKFADLDITEVIAGDCFEEVLVERVEHNLGWGRPGVLIDYPAKFAGYGRTNDKNPEIAERWELYLGGIEIANACSELTCPEDYRRRFANFAAIRESKNLRRFPLPEAFLESIQNNLPKCAGCALGIERLLLILTDSDRIGE